jgi:hypothetical protein
MQVPFDFKNAGDEEKLEYIRVLIEDGAFDDAQFLLDEFSYRGGAWYYTRGFLYYRKNWITDARNSLEDAYSIEPENDKYRAALNALLNYSDGMDPFNLPADNPPESFAEYEKVSAVDTDGNGEDYFDERTDGGESEQNKGGGRTYGKNAEVKKKGGKFCENFCLFGGAECCCEGLCELCGVCDC